MRSLVAALLATAPDASAIEALKGDLAGEFSGGGTRESRSAFLKAAAAAWGSGPASYALPSGRRTAAVAARLKPVSQLCTEEAKRAEPGGALETCAQGFERGVPCKTLYRTHSCCTHCDPCGFDGRSCNRAVTNPWLSPQCACEQVVLSGGCSYKGCAKPDALGVFTRSANWRTGDGRYVYSRDEVQPPQLHRDVQTHRAYDATSNSNRTEGVYLYFLPQAGAAASAEGLGAWVVGPHETLNDDNYARSSATAEACPNRASGWKFWWGGGVSPLGLYTTRYAPGWATSSRYPVQIACWSPPPKPPPPPPRPPPPPPPPPPMPPPPVRLVPGPFTGRLELQHGGVWGTVCDDNFHYSDATVACRQLGLGRVLKVWTRDGTDADDDPQPVSALGLSSSAWPVWLENLQCGGEEASLTECGFSGWASSDCDHSEDVHLLCAVRRSPPPPPLQAPRPPPDALLLAIAGMARGDFSDGGKGQGKGKGEPPSMSAGLVGALVGGGVGALVVLLGGIAVALLFVPRRGKRNRFAPAGDGDETTLDGNNRQVVDSR